MPQYSGFAQYSEIVKQKAVQFLKAAMKILPLVGGQIKRYLVNMKTAYKGMPAWMDANRCELLCCCPNQLSTSQLYIHEVLDLNIIHSLLVVGVRSLQVEREFVWA